MGQNTQNVRLHETTIDELYRLKSRKESYDDVVRELIALRDRVDAAGELDEYLYSATNEGTEAEAEPEMA